MSACISERTPVAISSSQSAKLRTGVQERHAGIVEPGQTVEFRVESFGDTVFQGKVAYISPSLDETMRTFTMEALVDNGDLRLKPGFFAKGVILTRRDEGVLAVPDAAVSTLAGVSSVYVVQDGKIAQQTVTLGIRQNNLWEVVDGLKGHETLAASRLNELATGVSVTTSAEGEGAGSGGGKRGGGNRGRRGQRGDSGEACRISVHRPVFAVMMSIALMVLGWSSCGGPGLGLMPRTDSPTVNVRAGLRAPAPKRSRRRSQAVGPRSAPS
jgi:hypothetical protein